MFIKAETPQVYLQALLGRWAVNAIVVILGTGRILAFVKLLVSCIQLAATNDHVSLVSGKQGGQDLDIRRQRRAFWGPSEAEEGNWRSF